jgi:hypothetical protein
LGMVSREAGHKRVPAPPHKITGTIRSAILHLLSRDGTPFTHCYRCPAIMKLRVLYPT